MAGGADTGDVGDLPEMAKEQGDKLSRSGDLEGAIAQYSVAISRADKLAGSDAPANPLLLARCYRNRATARISLAHRAGGVGASEKEALEGRKNLSKGAEDCAKAMQTLSIIPAESLDAPGVKTLLLPLLHRRTVALSALVAYALVLADYDSLISSLRVFGASSSSASSTSSSAPPPALPFALQTIEADREECTRLLSGFKGEVEGGKQHLPHKLEGDQLSKKGDCTAAIASYRASLLFHPGFLPSHVGMAQTMNKAGRWMEAQVQVTRAIEIWNESWTAPTSALVGPAKPLTAAERERVGMRPDAVSVDVVQRAATTEALAQRCTLLQLRAASKAALSQWLPAQTDLQEVRQISPLTSGANTPAGVQAELVFLAQRGEQGRLAKKADTAVPQTLQRDPASIASTAASSSGVTACTAAIVHHQAWQPRADASECERTEAQ